jgi:bacterioferritin-associated ferredoxin
MRKKEKKMTTMNNQQVKTESKKDITELHPNCGTSDCCGQCETAVEPIVKEEKQ